MEVFVYERLRELINFLKYTQKVDSDADFAQKSEIQKTHLSAMLSGNRTITDKTVTKICEKLPQVNKQWLLTGEGEMLKNAQNKSNVTQVIVEDDNIMRVPVVPIYAQAGFLPGVSDPVYIDTLPTMEVIVDKQYKGKYFIFEVHGDSMDDGTRDSLIEGDMVLCRSVHPDYWRSKLHYRQWKYWVIATKEEGIVIKQIVDHDVEGGIITVHSLNDYYRDYKIDLRDVQCLLNVTRIVERRI